MGPRSRSAWFAACALLIAGALLIAPRPAFACTPPPGGLPNYTAAQRTLDADVVLIGTVAALSNGPGIPGDTATIDVERYLKDSGPETLSVSGYGPSALCRSELQVGQRWIFYIVRDGQDTYRAYYKSQFDAVAPVSEQTVAEIEAAAAQLSPAIYLTWLSAEEVRIAPATTHEAAGRDAPPLSLATILLTLVGLVTVARRRP